MEGDNRHTSISSLLVHPAVICIWLLIAVAAGLYNQAALSLFACFVFMLTGLSYIWGRLALGHLEVTRRVSQRGIFPGQTVTVSRSVCNGKLLPLFWLELVEPCQPNGCLLPEKQYLAESGVPDSQTTPQTTWAMYTFNLIKWHQTLTCRDQWTARHRGICQMDYLRLRGGDGFGLYVRELTVPLGRHSRIAVYPQPAPVSADRVLEDMWDTRSGAIGYLEDPTILRSTRDYQPVDSAKRINQRLLARGQGLKVNEYEIVAPNAVLFILDTASFPPDASEALEQTLSIAAGLIMALAQRGIQTGLLSQQSPHFPQGLVLPSCQDTDRARMLERMAGASAEDIPFSLPVPLPPVEGLGQAYCLAYSLDTVTCGGVLGLLPPHKTQLLTALPADGPAFGLRVSPASRFRRGS